MTGLTIPPPTPGMVAPPGENTSGAVGAESTQFARADHQHPRLTSATNVLLDANGDGTVTFTRTFPVASPPTVAFARVPPISGAPCVFDVQSWTIVGASVTGCTVKGYRLSGPQSLAAVTVLGISVAVGGQSIITYGPANGVSVAVIALQASA